MHFRDKWADVGPRLTRLTDQVLAPGDVVPPGTWGRVVRPSPDDLDSIWPWEQLFEGIRAAEFPDRPSRLEVAYAFEGVPHDHTGMGNLLYLVTMDPAVRFFRGDMSWVGSFGMNPSSPEAAERARHYWDGEATEAPEWEWLIAGPLKVVGPVPTRRLPHARKRKPQGSR